MTSPTIDDVRFARQEADRLKKEVLDWMTDEGNRGHLRVNKQAPAWNRYESAYKRLDELREQFGV
jgi:hypothetical protein